MTEITLNKNYPVFLCKVKYDKLETEADWFRTALKGEKFFMLASEITRTNAALEYKFKKRFNKDLYYKDDEGNLKLSIKKDDIFLLVNSETIYGASTIECVYLDGEGMDQLGFVEEL